MRPRKETPNQASGAPSAPVTAPALPIPPIPQVRTPGGWQPGAGIKPGTKLAFSSEFAAWLRSHFESAEGQALILVEMKHSSNFLQYCIDRAYGPVKNVTVHEVVGLAGLPEKLLQAIIDTPVTVEAVPYQTGLMKEDQ